MLFAGPVGDDMLIMILTLIFHERMPAWLALREFMATEAVRPLMEAGRDEVNALVLSWIDLMLHV